MELVMEEEKVVMVILEVEKFELLKLEVVRVVMVILEAEKLELLYLIKLEGQPAVVGDVLEDEDIVPI